MSMGGVDLGVTLELQADGAEVVSVAGANGCAGTFRATGGTWASTGATVTFAGTPVCTGTVTCTVMGAALTLDCAATLAQVAPSGVYGYTLGNNSQTLTFTPEGDAGVSLPAYTRAP